MKTITMYELLGLVKDGKAPKKVKYKEVLYYDEELKNYYNDEDMHPLFDDITNVLDEEVEILEEEPYVEVCGSWFTKSEYDKLFRCEEEKKIPEKLETYKEVDEECYFANILKVSKNGECEIDEETSVIVDKVNEIINYLDYLKSKGE